MGRIYEDCFWLELDFPVSVHDGLGFLIEVTRVELRSDECDANYSPFDEMPGLRLGWVILSLQCMAYATKVFANR
ncbi:hypothetical protein IU323_004977 [Escherichia coli]|nr:hypothetical protein [Escherichia coli]